MNILIVDDDVDALVILRSTLEADGHAVRAAKSGREALALAGDEPPDLIVSDILMPDMDGFALIREIKRDERLRDAPFVFYTATFLDPRDEQLAHGLGAARFLYKPMDPVDLAATLRAVIEQHLVGALPRLPPPPTADADVDRLHRESLERKLEKKLGDLERERRMLRQLDRRYRQIVENALEGIWLLDAGGITVFVNDALARMLGCEPDGIVGRPVTDFVPPEDHDELRRRLERRLAGESSRSEFRLRRSDGTAMQVMVSASPVRDERGGVEAILGLVTDLSAIKASEEALRNSEERLARSQKLEAVGQLAGSVAHDFNNLLTAITGYSELLLANERLPGPLAGDVREIQRAAERGAALTRSLLAFARQQAVRLQVVDLNHAINEIERLLTRILGESIELVFRLGPSLRPVMADVDQLGQVLVNLIVNARDAMPEGGRVVLSTEEVTLTEDASEVDSDLTPGRYVRLAVADTGHGMDAATQERVFEPFFTTKEHGKGTGLGLSTVYGIVKQCGGSISLESGPSQGTTFSILLPTVEAEPSPAVRRPTEARGCDSRGETVLIVEDETGVRALSARILAGRGYTVLQAATGDEARRHIAAREQRIDLMLTDVVLPGAGGRILAAEAREARPDVKILFMSGYSRDNVTLNPQDEIGAHFLEKPFTVEQLLEKVREVLDS